MVSETMDAADGDARKARRNLGRVTPRESDERLLRDYAERMERGEITPARGRAK